MWFWKFRKHKPKYRYSLKEKETYYTNLSKNGTLGQKIIARHNLARLDKLKDMNNNFGKVLIARDISFYPAKSKNKSRRVIIVGYDKAKNKYDVIPVSKNGSGYLNLKNFDGNRYVESNRSYKLSSSQLYEHRGFGDNSNDYLTADEKKFILKKRSNK